MPPRLILIRHGQAIHNIEDDWGIKDPALTEKGIAQCAQLADHLKNKYDFSKDETLIIVSPLKRTLQSFDVGLRWLVEQGVPVQLRAEWQESTGNPCDVGTQVAVIEQEWPDLDFSQLDPVYPAKTGLYDPSEESLHRRALFAMESLYHRPERHIIVMTHSGFLRRVAPVTVKYANGEYRVYDFADEEDSTERQFKLVEVEQVHLPLETQQASVL